MAGAIAVAVATAVTVSDPGHAKAADDDREQALDRLLDHYLDTAAAANDHLRALPGQAVPDRFTGRDHAMAWFDAERADLGSVVTLAHTTGRHRMAYDLPICLNIYLSWRHALDDRLTVDTIAVTASSHLDDR
ncbi:hypothetical protein [Nonomuraea rubra]|uniref:hypothetical protein n=1 Tax=Nonomuraea rubra TaxID=46180 RepID=UPI0033D87890